MLPKDINPESPESALASEVDRTVLRKLIRIYCHSDSEFDAFCIDRFVQVFRQYSDGMDRTKKENLLLLAVEPQKLLSAIRAYVKDNLPSDDFEGFSRALVQAQSDSNNIASHDIPNDSILKMAATRHDPPQAQARWRAWLRRRLFSPLALAAVVLSLGAAVFFALRETAVKMPLQVFIVQSMTPDEWTDFEKEATALDTPEQFFQKLRKVEPNKVRYVFRQDQNRETKELLRLVLALLRATNERIALTQYGQEQARAWQNGATPEAQFLSELDMKIEKALKAEKMLINKSRLDLGVNNAENPGATSQIDMLHILPAEPAVPPAHSADSIAKFLPERESKIQKSAASEFKADSVLSEAQIHNINGEYSRAISLAKSVQKDNSMRAWRIIGYAACNIRNFQLISKSYRNVDKRSREYIGLICQRNGIGIRRSGSPFSRASR